MADRKALLEELKKLHPTFWPWYGKLGNCTGLELEGRSLTLLPPGICELTGLKVLDISDNKLAFLPPEISKLTALTRLAIYDNLLTSLPPEIAYLTGLTHLNICDNPIEELPQQITALKNLKNLWIHSGFDNISIKRAPRGVTTLPCWNNIKEKQGSLSVADALRKLELYDYIPTATAASSHSAPSRLASGKYADILALDFDRKENVLGKGGFGLVFKVQLKAGSFAVKLVANAESHAVADGSDPEKEGQMMMRLQHPNILALYDFGYRGKDLLFIMELADGGDLYSLIKKNKALGNESAMTFGLHIIQGLSYLHTRSPPIQHRDLKTQNVLLVKGVAKLTDFGLSKSGASVNSVSGFKGSINWSPPEAFDVGKSMGLPSDVYSYGVVLWSMLTGEYPYENSTDAEVGQRLLSGDLLPLPPTCPANLVSLIHKCWERDYDTRIGAVQVEEMLREVISTPISSLSIEAKSVRDMSTQELVAHLKGKNAHPDFIAVIDAEKYSGKRFVQLDEKDVCSAPFNMKKVQAAVILDIIAEAKLT